MVAATDTLTAQVSVLGALLIEPGLIGEVLLKTQDNDFTDNRCRMVYQSIRKMFTSGEPVDPVTVRDKLSRPGDTMWTEFVMTLMDATPTAANVWEYVRIMREQARLLRLVALGGSLQLATDVDSAMKIISKANEELVDTPGIKAVTMEQALTKFFDRHKTKREYLSWGMEPLDDKLYIGAGDFVVLGGYPSAGKTALALQYGWEMARKQGKRVGFFSLETGDEKLFDRLLASIARMDFGKIKRSNLEESDYEAISSMANRIVTCPVELIPAACMTVADIRSYALSRKYDVIFIDYLQLIQSDGWNRTEEVSRISMGLQQLAQGCGITTVALSQLQRPESSGKENTVVAPTMRSLRESGQIEQDADVVMLLYKEEDIPNSRRVLKIAKNKEGETGQLFLAFDGPHQLFRPSVVDGPRPQPIPFPRKFPPPVQPKNAEELAALSQMEMPF